MLPYSTGNFILGKVFEKKEVFSGTILGHPKHVLHLVPSPRATDRHLGFRRSGLDVRGWRLNPERPFLDIRGLEFSVMVNTNPKRPKTPNVQNPKCPKKQKDLKNPQRPKMDPEREK